jgi:anti-anti-sigma regulatory factor
MNFKIDTKEKFFVIDLQETELTANMAELLMVEVLTLSENKPNNVILKLTDVATMNLEAAQLLASCREKMYAENRSFVVCELPKKMLNQLQDWELDEAINTTPTESEAWDIVQMDEIEREFLEEETGEESNDFM